MTLAGPATDVVREMFTDNRTRGRRGKEFVTSHTAIPISAGEYIASLVEHSNAHSTIEVGLGLGVSAIFLADTTTDNGREHIAIDPYQSSFWDDAGLLAIERAQLGEVISVVSQKSEYYLPSLAYEESRFDLAFVDGDHHFEHVMLDLYYLGNSLSEHGCIVVDDIYLPSVKFAIRYFIRNMGWKLVDRPNIYDDLGRERLLTLKPTRYMSRPWNHFVQFI